MKQKLLLFGILLGILVLLFSIAVGFSSIIPNDLRMASAPRDFRSIENKHVAALAAIPPGEGEYLIDSVDVLSFEEEKDIELSLKALANSAGITMTVFTVPTFSPLSPDEYSGIIAEVWEYNYEDENWVLLAIGVEDGEIRYDTGTVFARNVPKDTMGAIVANRIEPFVKNGEWYNAINEGVLAIAGQSVRMQ